MKYLLFTLLCSLSVAQAMEKQSLEQMRLLSLQSAIKQEETVTQSELEALSKTIIDRKDPLALWEKDTTQHRLQSRLTEITGMLQWIQDSNPTHKEVSQAFINYQLMRDRLKEKATSSTQKTAAYWEGLAKRTPAPKVTASARFEAFAEEDDDDAELAQEHVPAARSQSVVTHRNISTTVTKPVRAHSAPVKIHSSRSRYGVSPESLDSIEEEDAAPQVAVSALSMLFETQTSNV